jgi:hypothetical protein
VAGVAEFRIVNFNLENLELLESKGHSAETLPSPGDEPCASVYPNRERWSAKKIRAGAAPRGGCRRGNRWEAARPSRESTTRRAGWLCLHVTTVGSLRSRRARRSRR